MRTDVVHMGGGTGAHGSREYLPVTNDVTRHERRSAFRTRGLLFPLGEMLGGMDPAAWTCVAGAISVVGIGVSVFVASQVVRNRSTTNQFFERTLSGDCTGSVGPQWNDASHHGGRGKKVVVESHATGMPCSSNTLAGAASGGTKTTSTSSVVEATAGVSQVELNVEKSCGSDAAAAGNSTPHELDTLGCHEEPRMTGHTSHDASCDGAWGRNRYRVLSTTVSSAWSYFFTFLLNHQHAVSAYVGIVGAGCLFSATVLGAQLLWQRGQGFGRGQGYSVAAQGVESTGPRAAQHCETPAVVVQSHCETDAVTRSSDTQSFVSCPPAADSTAAADASVFATAEVALLVTESTCRPSTAPAATRQRDASSTGAAPWTMDTTCRPTVGAAQDEAWRTKGSSTQHSLLDTAQSEVVDHAPRGKKVDPACPSWTHADGRVFESSARNDKLRDDAKMPRNSDEGSDCSGGSIVLLQYS